MTYTTESVPPALFIENPGNNSKFDTASVEFNVSGNEDLHWCGLSIDGGDNITMTEFNTTYFNYTNGNSYSIYNSTPFAKDVTRRVGSEVELEKET